MKSLNEPRRASDFFRLFLTTSKDAHVDREGIESLLYDIKDEEQDIYGRAIHIGDGYFLTAGHVIEEDSGLQLVPQLAHDNKSRHAEKFEVITHNMVDDLALLMIDAHEKSGSPLIRLATKIPQLGESVSEFTRYDGDKVDTDYVFQFEHEHVHGLGRIILRTNSAFLEKQGEVEYNSDYPRYPGFVHTFGAPIPALVGDSGSPVFLKVDNGKYMLAGIASKVYGSKFPILTANHPFFNKNGYFMGAIVVDREPIERLISQYLVKSTQTLHPPSR